MKLLKLIMMCTLVALFFGETNLVEAKKKKSKKKKAKLEI